MYAVIETGGKQYRVELGTELAVERLDATPGSSISFDRVLLVADGDNAQVGTPTVADALVTADVLRQDRADKVIVFKYRPKARHRSKRGHRQEQTIIRVADIRFDGRSAAQEQGVEKAQESKARKQAQAEAERKATADQALAAKLAADAAKAEKAASAATDVAKAPGRKPSSAKATTRKSASGDPTAAQEPTAKKPTPRRKSAAAAKSAAPETSDAAAEADNAPAEGDGEEKATKKTRARSTRSTKKDE